MALERGLAVKETIPLGHIGKAMAKGMKASVGELALSQISREIDMSALKALLRDKFTASSPPITLNTLIMAAVARTLPDHPFLNAELRDKQIVVYEPINLGMAIATSEGLVVAVIPQADKLSLPELAAIMDDRVVRAREGKLGLSDIEGGTFTVSNIGMYGVDSGFPLPRPPESAILLFGAIRPRPSVVNDQIVVREVCHVALTFDHRFIDGITAAAFLEDLNDLYNMPEELLKL